MLREDRYEIGSWPTRALRKESRGELDIYVLESVSVVSMRSGAVGGARAGGASIQSCSPPRVHARKSERLPRALNTALAEQRCPPRLHSTSPRTPSNIAFRI